MIEQLALQDIAGTIAGEVSHGAQKQVELGIALAGKPRMLLLDEPTAGMSAQETHESIAPARPHRQGAGADAAVHRARHGRRVLDRAHRSPCCTRAASSPPATPEEVRSNEEVRRVYLGGGKH